MIIFLRQANVDPSAKGSISLTIQDCCFIRIKNAELYPEGLQFHPRKGIDYDLIRKTGSGDWIEPMSKIKYDFLFIYKLYDYIPRHLEILYPKASQLHQIRQRENEFSGTATEDQSK